MTTPTARSLFQTALELHQAGRLPEAEDLYRRVLAREPAHAGAMLFLGVIALYHRRHDVALQLISQSIDLDPKQPSAYSNLGLVFHAMGRYEEAIAQYHLALELRPNEPISYYNLANAQRRSGRMIEAIESYRQAIRLKPDYVEAYNNLGDVLKNGGQLDEGLAAFRQAIAIKPDYHQAHSNLLLSLHYHPRLDARAIAEEHRQWDLRRSQAQIKQSGTLSTTTPSANANSADADRRLRIGYVSADFRNHAVTRFLLPLLANHDHEAVEVFAYAQSHVVDPVTEQIRTYTDRWRGIASLSDTQAAEQIRNDQIDILIDLAGHTADNRLLIFALKPAPVQVTYLGYPDTTGLSVIDYRFTDAFADPPGMTEHFHSEKLFRLVPSAWCFTSTTLTPLPLRATGPITFGCFNTFAKITDAILEPWSRILRATADSRLLLKCESLGSASVRIEMQRRFAGYGIDPARLDLRGQEPEYDAHLSLYGKMDIALDTFPYHGTTTTCEALWMGVPVVSLAGVSHMSRVGVSLLSNVGLPELIAETPDEYVRLAVELAGDRTRLRELHSTLRQRMERSPLMDGPAFARQVEAAFRQMWRTWCESA